MRSFLWMAVDRHRHTVEAAQTVSIEVSGGAKEQRHTDVLRDGDTFMDNGTVPPIGYV